MGKRIRVGVEHENYLIRMGWLGYANHQLEVNDRTVYSRAYRATECRIRAMAQTRFLRPFYQLAKSKKHDSKIPQKTP